MKMYWGCPNLVKFIRRPKYVFMLWAM